MNRLNDKNIPKGLNHVVEVFSALGDVTRQKIILLFEPGEELSIKDIAGQFDLGRTTVVHHLTVLYNSGVLNMRRKGRQTLYSVAYEEMLGALQKAMLLVEDKIWEANRATMRSSATTVIDSGLTFSDDEITPDISVRYEESEYTIDS